MVRTLDLLALLVVLVALLSPNRIGDLGPSAFVRIPAEALVVLALVVALPARPARVAAWSGGGLIALLTLGKLLDVGFFAVLARPFDPILDWLLIGFGVEFLNTTLGRPGAVLAVIGILVLVAATLVLVTRSVVRLTRLAVRRRALTGRAVAALSVVWIGCAAVGVQVDTDQPVAASATRDRVQQFRTGLRDQADFTRESAIDAFRDVPAGRLLTGLRGKDVLLVFIEAYGRSAVQDPRMAAQVDAVLADGDRRLSADGFGARSAFLTSPTAGGASWLAHSTLLSGLWINGPPRYRQLVSTDRLTLNTAFERAGWRSVGVLPAITRAWPDGRFYGYDRLYDQARLDYRGPRFGYAPMTDQYVLAALQRAELAKAGHAPVMATVALVSSHAPWAPLPELVGWDQVGDGSIFGPIQKAGQRPDDVWPDPTKVRAAYRRSIEYTLKTLVSYLTTYGDDNTVMIFLGDHQPLPLVTGERAGRDVPITIVARDPAVLDQISGWGWDQGLNPQPNAPVWRMDAFRDRFLTAFGSRP